MTAISHRFYWITLIAGLMSCSEQRAEHFELSNADAAGSPHNLEQFFAGRFYLVKKGGTITRAPVAKPLQRGFGLSVVQTRREKGDWIGITPSGYHVRLHDLEQARPSSFAGVVLPNGHLDQGWVVQPHAPVFSAPSLGAQRVRKKDRLALVHLVSHDGPKGYYRIGEGWMQDTALAIPTLAARPADVGPREAWIDVDLRSQTLVAYQGNQPLFATLISAGVGAPGTVFATPVGNHRIQSKLLKATMDNLSHVGVIPYYYEEVPFVQYIGRVALHGIYWHDGFGQRRSHGCINLSVRDARWLFTFTKPDLPQGVTEIAAGEKGGTVVRVR